MKTYHKDAANSTNAALILTGVRTLKSLVCENTTATKRFVKVYDKATAPTVGTDVPLLNLPVPAKAKVVLTFNDPMQFALGLGVAMTANQIYTDSTAVAADALRLDVKYN